MTVSSPQKMDTYRIGVLALQGAVSEHLSMINIHMKNLTFQKKEFGQEHPKYKLEAVEIRHPEDFLIFMCEGKQSKFSVDALILPGGESSTIRGLLKEEFMVKSTAASKEEGDVSEIVTFLGLLKEFKTKGNPIWGICAGMILLCDKIKGDTDLSINETQIGGLPCEVTRNYFGRQSSSILDSDLFSKIGVSHYIRAPAIEQKEVELKAMDIKVFERREADKTCKSEVVTGVRKNNLYATAFHPEISEDMSNYLSFLIETCKVSLISSDDELAVSNHSIARLPSLNTIYPELPALKLMTEKYNRYHPSVKVAMPKFLKGGVIMDVVNAEQARIAEAAGAVSVMALERIPADIKQDGGVARMSDPTMIKEIMETVSIPVMAKARIGHWGEAKVLEALDVDCIDESEVLTPADETYHIEKTDFKIPFVCGAKDLGEALRRISEGAAMIRLKGNAGTGNVLHAVRHARSVFGQIKQLQHLEPSEVAHFAKEHLAGAPKDLVEITRKLGRLPVTTLAAGGLATPADISIPKVTTFAAGGLATPADVSLLMKMGCDGVFVGSGIFKGEKSAERARAMVKACTWWDRPEIIAEVSCNLGKAMVGRLDKGESYNYVKDGVL